MRDFVIQGSYLSASVLFILGLRSLTRPDKARRGMQLAAAGMVFAIVGTLINHQIVDYRWIAGGLVLGVIIGYPMGMWVPMTAMPQRIALSLTFSALAATLVGVAEFYTEITSGGIPTHAKMAALGELAAFLFALDGPVVLAEHLQHTIGDEKTADDVAGRADYGDEAENRGEGIVVIARAGGDDRSDE